MAVLLIAEDDEDVCSVLTIVFRRAGFVVLTAGDGAAALELATRVHPDVILTDLDMPKLTGLELCQAIRAHPDLRHVPVAILSGSLRPGDPRAEQAHVCAVLLKPFSNNDLVAAVQRLVDDGPHGHSAGVPDVPPSSTAAAR